MTADIVTTAAANGGAITINRPRLSGLRSRMPGKPLFRLLHGNRQKAADVERQLCPLNVNSILAKPGLDEMGTQIGFVESPVRLLFAERPIAHRGAVGDVNHHSAARLEHAVTLGDVAPFPVEKVEDVDREEPVEGVRLERQG